MVKKVSFLKTAGVRDQLMGEIWDKLDPMPTVKVLKLHPEAKMPTKATKGAACWDVYSIEELFIDDFEFVYEIHTGLSFEVPLGFFLDIRPRSGLAKEGFIIPNSPGTLDSDYRGEFIVLARFGAVLHGETSILPIRKGDRIAQIRLVKCEDVKFKEVKKLSKTKRGTGGFGSTGR